MREIMPLELQRRRMAGVDEAHPTDWRFGAYKTYGPCGVDLTIVSSMDYGWEHVSASVCGRLDRTFDDGKSWVVVERV